MKLPENRFSYDQVGLVTIGLAASVFYFFFEKTMGTYDSQTNIIVVTIMLYSLVTQLLMNKVQKSQARLRESERKYRLLAENATDVIWTLDENFNFTYFSPSIQSLSGYTVEEIMELTMEDVMTSESSRMARSFFETHLDRGSNSNYYAPTFEYQQIFKDGTVAWMEAQPTFIYSEEGGFKGIQCASRDITRRKVAEDALRRANETLEVKVKERTAALRESNEQLNDQIRVRQEAEERLRDSETRYRSIFENTGAATIIIDREMIITLANSEFENVSGFSKEEIEGRKSWLEFIHMNDLEKVLRFTQAKKEGSGALSRTSECTLVNKVGSQRNILVTFAPIPGTEESVVSLSDVSELKAAEQQIYFQAFHDTLTKLPNRSLFMDHLNMAIKRRKRLSGYRFAVIYLDIDRFKNVNDSLGHLVGDRLLVSFAQRLAECLRDIDTLARLGGDEFAILLEDIESADSAVGIAERILQSMGSPYTLDNSEVFTTASLGIVLNTEDYERAENLIRDADTAMYHAKEKGKSRYEIFDKTLHEKALLTLQLETDLRKGIEREEFELHYQPIVSVITGHLIGFEALIRWRHPDHGLVFPNVFIPIAEETGLIIPLGRWVLRAACVQMMDWQKTFKEAARFSMSVNISGKQFSNPELVRDVQEILRETRIPPGRLKLEITESVIMEDATVALHALHRLKELGIQIVIDDFGTGYSSLSYLQQLPIDTLKVDRSFVMPMRKEITENRQIVEAIISLAHRLGINVIAEGVETVEQRAILSDMKCQLAQGYLFAKPMDLKAASDYVRADLNLAES